jgi:thermostable 8-oxoguanine DNA glycosylase
MSGLIKEEEEGGLILPKNHHEFKRPEKKQSILGLDKLALKKEEELREKLQNSRSRLENTKSDYVDDSEWQVNDEEEEENYRKRSRNNDSSRSMYLMFFL